jgi:hypothetical protein
MINSIIDNSVTVGNDSKTDIMEQKRTEIQHSEKKKDCDSSKSSSGF